MRPGTDRWRLQDVEPAIHVVERDLSDSAGLEHELNAIRPELCFHLAWYVTPGAYLESPHNLDALQIAIRLVAQLRTLGCERFVGVGSCFEYDTSLGTLSEDSPVHTDSLYAASKLALSLVVQALARLGPMRATWIRLFYQYGPMEDERRLVPSIITSLLRGRPVALTPGKQVRDFLHVSDVARGILAAGAAGLDGPVNIGSGRGVSIESIATTLGAQVGRPDLLRLGARPADPRDPKEVVAVNARLVTTGWQPRYSLETGLAETISWWRGRIAHLDAVIPRGEESPGHVARR